FVTCQTNHLRNKAGSSMILSTPLKYNGVDILLENVGRMSDLINDKLETIFNENELTEGASLNHEKPHFAARAAAKFLLQESHHTTDALSDYEIISRDTNFEIHLSGELIKQKLSISHSQDFLSCASSQVPIGISLKKIEKVSDTQFDLICNENIHIQLKSLAKDYFSCQDYELKDIIATIIQSQKEALLKLSNSANDDLEIDSITINLPFSVNLNHCQYEVFTTLYENAHVLSIVTETSRPEADDANKVFVTDIAISELQEHLLDGDLNNQANCYFSNITNIEGIIRPDDLQKSINHILEQHQILNTVFYSENDQIKGTLCSANEIPLNRIDCSHEDPSLQDAFAEAYIDKHMDGLFDLRKGPLWQALLFEFSPDINILAIVYHHAIMDCLLSYDFNKELWSYYQDLSNGLDLAQSHTIQYNDFAIRDTGMLTERQLNYWQDLFTKTQQLHLPALNNIGSQTANVIQFTIDENISKQLEDFSKSQSVSLFATLCSAFSLAMMSRYDQKDILINLPFSVKDPLKDKGALGLFVKCLPIHLEASNQLTDMLQSVRQSIFDSYEHRNIALNKLDEICQGLTGTVYEKDVICQIINVDNDDTFTLEDLGLKSRTIESRNDINFKICFTFVKNNDKLYGNMAYHRAYISDQDAADIIQDTKDILDNIGKNKLKMNQLFKTHDNQSDQTKKQRFRKLSGIFKRK
ncbi:MAG: hypothetical protein HRT89_10265, partial [Lentisphaeria bacterium]|nr:hypothetical protein [Lentisphaeria bacterium]